jgi:diguanylate cyclase (GGDEF)-like protein/PAS domain S-box-containing protein
MTINLENSGEINMLDNILEVLLDAIPYSIWLKSSEGNYIFVNQYFCDSLNISKSDILGKTVYDIYGKKFCKEYAKNYKEVQESGIPRLFTGYQEEVFIEYYIAPIKKENKIVAYLSILQDQTKRKRDEEETIKQKNLLKTLIDTIPDSIFYKDIDGKYLDCNIAFAKDYYQCSKGEVIGKKDKDMTSNEKLLSDILVTDRKVIKNKEKQVNSINIENDGQIKYMECIKAPILDNKKDVWGIIGVSRDITKRVLSEKELKKISYTDKLTDVYNRTYFDKKIKSLNTGNNLPLSLIMGDVDGLKIVNDTLGHLKGDELLVQITNVLKKVCKKESLIVRWGGDEFVILLPSTENEEANEICNKIKSACKKESYTSIPLRISLGCATKTNINQNINDVLKEAEDKLYKEKLPNHIDSKKRTLSVLNKALTEKSLETKQHTDRVVNYVKRLGNSMGLNSSQMKELILSAKLHDIGKIGISDEILSKPEKLTDDEFDIIKTHTEKGYRVAKSNYEIAHVANNILSHHERWDGKGYPLGLKGKKIPLLSRIICIADSYDAMISERSYKSKMSKEEAIKEIKKCSGKQFDPEIAKIFIKEFSR